jgi:hypothetical protein
MGCVGGLPHPGVNVMARPEDRWQVKKLEEVPGQPSKPTVKWAEAGGGQQTYDPSPSTGYQQPYNPAYEAPIDPYGQQPYDRSYGDQAYKFAPPQPQYAYPPPYAYPYPYPYPRPVKPPNPSLPVGGGVLVLISGVLSLVWTFIMMGGAGLFGLGLADPICLTISFIFPTIAIIGGIFAIMRRGFPFAITGGIFAMLSIAFFGVALVMGLVGMILIAVSHDAFLPTGQAPMRTY